jgi:preprotein translocase subunit SecD
MVILAVVVAGIGAAAFVGGGDSNPEPQPAASETSRPVVAGVFQLRQVLFQETGRIQKEPPLRPGPAKGGPNATRDLLRIDCQLKPRPMKDDDNVILCDADGFRYGLGPSELPASPVESAAPAQGASGEWVVSVQLTQEATAEFEDVTGRVAGMGPPLNQLAIVINGVVVTAPRVEEAISGGQLQISGPLTQQDAQALAASLG